MSYRQNLLITILIQPGFSQFLPHNNFIDFQTLLKKVLVFEVGSELFTET